MNPPIIAFAPFASRLPLRRIRFVWDMRNSSIMAFSWPTPDESACYCPRQQAKVKCKHPPAPASVLRDIPNLISCPVCLEGLVNFLTSPQSHKLGGIHNRAANLVGALVRYTSPRSITEYSNTPSTRAHRGSTALVALLRTGFSKLFRASPSQLPSPC